LGSNTVVEGGECHSFKAEYAAEKPNTSIVVCTLALKRSALDWETEADKLKMMIRRVACVVLLSSCIACSKHPNSRMAG
jgi:hypothetical protein